MKYFCNLKKILKVKLYERVYYLFLSFRLRSQNKMQGYTNFLNVFTDGLNKLKILF